MKRHDNRRLALWERLRWPEILAGEAGGCHSKIQQGSVFWAEIFAGADGPSEIFSRIQRQSTVTDVSLPAISMGPGSYRPWKGMRLGY